MTESFSGAQTFYEALRPHTREEDALIQFIPFQDLFARFLGVVPNCFPILYLSRAAINSFSGLFSRSFNSPNVDIGLSEVSTSLRRKIFLASSRAFECNYCTAHACSMGDMLRGSMEEQLRVGVQTQPEALDPDSPQASVPEIVVMRFANAISRRGALPSEHTLSPLAAAVKEQVGPSGLETVMAIICMTGWLNTFMDVIGVELEGEAEQFTRQHFESLGLEFEAGIHKSTKSETPPPNLQRSNGILGAIANAFGLIQVMPSALRAMAVERELYAGIPSDLTSLDEWLSAKLGGSVPSFVKNITGVQFKRAVCFGLRENMLPEGNENGNEERVWKRDERCALMFLYGQLVVNDGMMQLAESLSLIATKDDLQCFADGVQSETWSIASMHAKQVVVDQSMKPENVSTETIELLGGSCEPEGIVELVAFIGWLCFWHRSSVVFRSGSQLTC